MRLDLTGTGTALFIEHVAACPEVAPEECAATDLPDHRHEQDVFWVRAEPAVAIGLGRGFQLSAQIPFDYRSVEVRYTMLDGEPYDAPYGDIHHRTEQLYGLVDATAMARHYGRAGEFTLGAGLGSTIPLGRTEEDPYAAGEAGEQHQHLQLGSGTFNPVGSLEGVWQGRRWGALGWAFGRLPFYENDKGYQAPITVSGGLGPSFRLLPALTLLLGPEGSWESVERWNGTEYAGRAAIGLAGGGIWSVSKQVTAQLQARGNLWQTVHHLDEEGSVSQPLTVSIGIGWQTLSR